MQNEQRLLVIERIAHAPVDLVWKSLTDIALLKQWLPFFAEFKPEVGFETRFKLGKDDDHQYEHVCRVLEVIPKKKLTYTWYYAGYEGRSQVTFELLPEGDQTKIMLTHVITEEFPKDNPDFDRKNFKEGWTYTIDALKNFVQSHPSLKASDGEGR
jgi:uncharacterized protein YndB with AHSA1/START domain